MANGCAGWSCCFGARGFEPAKPLRFKRPSSTACAARRTAWQTIRSLKDLGKTVLLTTHYLDEAQELADRVAIIKGGQILAEGSPAELGVGAGSRYRVAYVKAGEPVIHQTDDPTSFLHALTADALARGERLEGLSVTRPSLEEIYLELTADG